MPFKKILIAALLLLCVPLPCLAQSIEHKHFWKSKRFWVTFSIDAAASMADYSESQHAWALGYHEGDPIFGSGRPGMARMTGVGLPLTFAISLASFRASESSNKFIRELAPLPVAYDTINHVRLAISSSQLSCIKQTCTQ